MEETSTIKTFSSDGYQQMDRLPFSFYQNVSGKIIMSTNTFSARVTLHHLQYCSLRSLQKTLSLCACHGISFSYFLSLSLPLPSFLLCTTPSLFLSFPLPPTLIFPQLKCQWIILCLCAWAGRIWAGQLPAQNATAKLPGRNCVVAEEVSQGGECI